MEQVTKRATAMGVHPSAAKVLGTIVHYMASLAKCGELVKRIVTGIMGKMSARKYYWRQSSVYQKVFHGPSYAPAVTVSPV